jgi:hypothetical protein
MVSSVQTLYLFRIYLIKYCNKFFVGYLFGLPFYFLDISVVLGDSSFSSKPFLMSGDASGVSSYS